MEDSSLKKKEEKNLIKKLIFKYVSIKWLTKWYIQIPICSKLMG